MNNRRPERESIWSVGRRWLPWCLGLIFALTIGWTAFIAVTEVSGGKHDGMAATVRVVVSESAPAVQLIVVYAIFIITVLDIAGGATMVTYRYLERKFLKPLEEKLRAEARAEGVAEGIAEGRAEGVAEGVAEGRSATQHEWEGWNRRREEAAARGEPFSEPPPGS